MNHLEQIAEQMRTQLKTLDKGWTQKALFGGLVIVLERRGRTWRLAIGRVGAPPSKTEAETVAKAFALHPGIEWSWGVRKKRVTYQVAECVWEELESEP